MLCTALPLLVALLAPPAPPPSTAADDDVETIEITARRERRDARDATLAVDTLRPADDPRPLVDLGALLERAPGLRVLRGGDAGGRQTVQLRGAGGHQVALLLDDVPLSAVRGVAVDLSTIPPSMLASAQVVRGPAAAAYGSGAQGGALRLQTRAVDGPQVDARLRGGSFGLLQGSAAGAVGGRAADGLLVVDGSRSDGDFDYRDAQGRPASRLNNDHRRIGGLLRGRVRLGAVEATALAHGLYAERGEPGSDQFPDGDARTERDQALVALGARGDGLDARLAWRARGWWLRRRSTYSDPTGNPVEVPAVVHDRTAGLRTEAEWHGFEDHRPSLAIEARHDRAESRAPAESSGEDRLGAALTAGWTWEVDTLRVAPLLRVDALEGRAAAVVPKLGLVWTAFERAPARAELRGNGGRLFRDPGFDELYVRGQGIEGDPTLRPEDGWGADLGLNLALERPRWHVELDGMLFTQRYDRMILFLPDDAYTVRARGDNAAAVQGVELALRAAWGPLAFEGTWLGQAARFTAPLDAPLPDRPASRLVGMLTATLGPLRPFALGRWQSAVYADRFGSRTRAGYATVDLGLAARLPAGFSVSAELRNGLDAQAFDLLQRPLPGRSVVVELGWIGD